MSAFRILRQDDNGHVFEVAVFAARTDARSQLAELEALSHKQTYWVEEATCIFAMDVAYEGDVASGAGVAFAPWDAASSLTEIGVTLEGVAPYEPGAFFKRELPTLVALVDEARGAGLEPDVLVVDGYAQFSPSAPALGARLHEVRGLPVVGVSKTPFHGATHEEVLRGSSASPLYVTAVGLGSAEAARAVRAMHGAHRIPTMLARADHEARRRASSHGRSRDDV